MNKLISKSERKWDGLVARLRPYLVVLAVITFSGIVFAQGRPNNISGSDELLRELITEIRDLRQQLADANSLQIRAMSVVEKMRIQADIVSRIVEDLRATRSDAVIVFNEDKRVTEQVQTLRTQVSLATSDDERSTLAAELKQAQTNLEEIKTREIQLRDQENRLNGDLQIEKNNTEIFSKELQSLSDAAAKGVKR